MSRNDFRVYNANGGMARLKAYPLSASTTIDEGEPVQLAGGGQLIESVSDPAAVAGICAVPTARRGTNGIIIAAMATGTLIQVYDNDRDTRFVTRRFATDGAGTPTAPTIANAVGERAGFIQDGSGNWFVDTGAANEIIEIEKVLTSDGRVIGDPGNTSLTGTQVVFRFLQ